MGNQGQAKKLRKRRRNERCRRKDVSRQLLCFSALEDRRLLAATVDTLSDVVDPNDGLVSLREAIAIPAVGTIDFSVTGVIDLDPSLGELAIDQSVSIVGPGQDLLTIDGQLGGDGFADGDGFRVFNIDDADPNFSISVEISGLTITGGDITGSSLATSGSGIRSRESLSLTEVTVTGNHAFGDGVRGGGISFRGSAGAALTITDSIISNNRSDLGGGLATSLADDQNGSVVITRTTIGDNFAGNAGGGIFNRNGVGTSFDLFDSTISSNVSRGDGGGIYSRHNNDDQATITITGSIIRDNRTEGSDADGGGISIENGIGVVRSSEISGNRTFGSNADGGGAFAFVGGLLIFDSTISGNQVLGSGSQGGGVFGGADTIILVIESTISQNRSLGVDGGAAGIGSFANVTLRSSTISGNRAEGDRSRGGGLSVDGNLQVDFSTIAFNYVNDTGADTLGGGGVRKLSSSDNFFLRDTVVANNLTATETAPDILVGASVPLTVTYSLIGDTSGSGVTAETGPGNLLDTDPQLSQLGFFGGQTQTHLLLAASPAINAARPEIFGTVFAFDQRGDPFTRVVGGRADIGAFEVQPDVFGSPLVTSVVRDEGGVLARPDLLTTFSVTFDQDVSVDVSDLSIVNDTLLGAGVDLSAIGFNYSAATRTATWDFSSLTLDPSFYSFELSDNITSVASGQALDGDVDGTAGGDLVESVYVALPGDANLDGSVDVLGDAFALVGSLGTTSGAVWADGDFNGDGAVNVLDDAFILVGRLGQSVLPPAAGSFSVVSSGISQRSDENVRAEFAVQIVETDDEPIARQTYSLQKDRISDQPTREDLSLAGSQALDAVFAFEDF